MQNLGGTIRDLGGMTSLDTISGDSLIVISGSQVSIRDLAGTIRDLGA